MEAVRKENVIEIPITKEMKARQKELAEVYRNALESIWKSDEKMVDWCVKNTYWYVELPNGMIIPISKKNIETRFCFGYSDWYDGFSYEDAVKQSDNARHSESHFIRENIEHYDRLIDNFAGDTRFTNIPYLRVKYYRLPNDSKIRELCWSHYDFDGDRYWYKQGKYVQNGNNNDYVPTSEELVLIRHGYCIARQLHMKRIMTYLKKYGLKSVHSWTYWMDE